jgi:hypothetical protein
MKRKIAGTAADPTLPKTPVVIGGKTYNLCLTLGALAEAEAAINAELLVAGRVDLVNLLFALPVQNLSNTRMVFAGAIRTFHPEISYEEALKLPALSEIYDVAILVKKAWDEASARPEASLDPLQPSK